MGPRMREDKGGGGRIPNRRYVGVAEHDEDGQPQGLPLRRRGAGYSREKRREGGIPAFTGVGSARE